MVARAHSLGLKAGWYLNNCICNERHFTGSIVETIQRRDVAAHRVGVESFVAFGPLAIFGIIKMPADGLLGLMALVYFFAIIAHYVIYSLGIVVVRTVLFLVASGASIIMALRLLGWI